MLLSSTTMSLCCVSGVHVRYVVLCVASSLRVRVYSLKRIQVARACSLHEMYADRILHVFRKLDLQPVTRLFEKIVYIIIFVVTKGE